MPASTPFTGAIGTITWVLSATVTFKGLSIAYDSTRPWVIETAQQYTRDIGNLEIIALVWMIMLGFLIFAASRAVLSGLVSALALWLLHILSSSGRGGRRG